MKNQIYQAAILLAILMSATSLTNAQNWLLNGNGPLTPGNFLGTSTNDPLVFKTSAVERMRIVPNTGFIGIGTNNPLSPLDLLNSTQLKSLNLKHNLNTASTNVAYYATTSNTGSGLTYAFYSDLPSTSTGSGVQGAYFAKVSGSGSGNHYGTYTQVTGTGSGMQYGSYLDISNTANGEHTGYYSALTGPGTGNQYGTRASITNTGTGTHYGVYAVLSGANAISKYGVYSSATGGANDYAFYGIGRSYFSDKVGIGVTQPLAKLHVSSSTDAKNAQFRNDYSGTSTKYGIHNEVTSLGTGTNYGIYNICTSDANDSDPAYGIYSSATDNGSGDAIAIKGVGKSGTGKTYGVHGVAQGAGANNFGVRGEASGSDYNTGISASATGGKTNYGIYAYANSSDNNYAVYGLATGSTNSWAGYFYGKTYVATDLLVGTTTGAEGYNLSVNGKIICEELRVANSSNWPDYVFDENYKLPSLEEVEQHIKDKKHLPGIPSANEVEAGGLHLGEMQKKMMEKIEELTLYLIELKKENKILSERLLNVEIKN